MSVAATMEAAVHAYVAAFDHSDAVAIANLYAIDARVEDPIGSPPHVGREAIETFYRYAVTTGAKLVLDGPIRIAGHIAAFPFHVSLNHGGQPTRIDVIDLFHFDEAGQITLMQAYWGETNVNSTGSTL